MGGLVEESTSGTADELVGCREADGGLYGGRGAYICWHPGETTVKLDGDFTADELRAIAAYMSRPKEG